VVFILTGGARYLKILDRLIAEETGLPVHIADDPLTWCGTRWRYDFRNARQKRRFDFLIGINPLLSNLHRLLLSNSICDWLID